MLSGRHNLVPALRVVQEVKFVAVGYYPFHEFRWEAVVMEKDITHNRHVVVLFEGWCSRINVVGD